MTTALLMRVAGVSALLALLALLLAGTFLVLFFRRGQPYGSLNDFFSALALLLLILPAAAVYVVAWNDVGWWLLLLTIAAVAGMALAAAGQLLLILRIIDLRTSFVTGGVGIAPVLAWLGGTAWLALAQHLLPEAVGWFGAAALGSAALVTLASIVKLDLGTWLLSAALITTIAGWLVALGSALLNRG